MTVLTGDTWRISVLTPHLVRLEQQPDGVFEDRPTQVVPALLALHLDDHLLGRLVELVTAS